MKSARSGIPKSQLHLAKVCSGLKRGVALAALRAERPTFPVGIVPFEALATVINSHLGFRPCHLS